MYVTGISYWAQTSYFLKSALSTPMILVAVAVQNVGPDPTLSSFWNNKKKGFATHSIYP